MPTARAIARLLGASLVGAILLGGCSAVLPPPGNDVPCAIPEGGTDPCSERGLVCSNGFCRLPEVCNGVDDDLDAVIDEGFDADRDGYTYCGGTTPELADCDDTNPLVRPGDPPVEEICDGRDNQCDGVDVDVASCPIAGEVCSRTLGACVTPVCSLPEFQCGVGSQCVDNECRPGDCTTMPCTEAGAICDPITRACVIPRELGASCTNDAECLDKRCSALRSLGITAGPTTAARNVCVTACCVDSDCPGGFLCWQSGTGVRACVASQLIAEGALGVPDPATERGCTRPADCSSGACTLGRFTAHDRERTGFICGAGPSDAAACYQHDECASGACLFGHTYTTWWGETYRYGPCTGACGTDADCRAIQDRYNGSFENDNFDSSDVAMACVAGRALATSDWIQFCAESSGAGAGTTCRSDADCLDRACVSGVCRATCCRDADCGAPDLCRPIERGDHWEMLCAPPSF